MRVNGLEVAGYVVIDAGYTVNDEPSTWGVFTSVDDAQEWIDLMPGWDAAVGGIAEEEPTPDQVETRKADMRIVPVYDHDWMNH